MPFELVGAFIGEELLGAELLGTFAGAGEAAGGLELLGTAPGAGEAAAGAGFGTSGGSGLGMNNLLNYGSFGANTAANALTGAGMSFGTDAATTGLFQQLSSLSGLTTDQLARLGGAGISSLASLYGAGKIGQASMDAANRLATANQSATQLQSQIYQDQLSRSQPIYQAGINALGPYTKGIMGTPEDQAAGRPGSLVRPFDVNKDYAQSPWYQASLDKRLKDYTNKMGSMGLIDSGPTRRGILDVAGRAGQEDITNAYNRYNQDLTTQRNALGNLAGFAPPAAAVLGAAGSNYATSAGNLGINTAANYAGADLTGAAARQSAYEGAGRAFSNAASPNPLNAYLNRQFGALI